MVAPWVKRRRINEANAKEVAKEVETKQQIAEAAELEAAEQAAKDDEIAKKAATAAKKAPIASTTKAHAQKKPSPVKKKTVNKTVSKSSSSED